jgi:hypothetical protein
MNGHEIASFGPRVGCRWGSKGIGNIPAMVVPSDAWCVVRASVHSCCDGSQIDQNTVRTVVYTTTHAPSGKHSRHCKYPRLPSEHPANVKVCSCTPNAVHTFCAHCIEYRSAIPALLHLVPGSGSLIRSQGSASRNGGLRLQGGLGKDSRAVPASHRLPPTRARLPFPIYHPRPSIPFAFARAH